MAYQPPNAILVPLCRNDSHSQPLAQDRQSMFHRFDLRPVEQIHQAVYLNAIHSQPASQFRLPYVLSQHGVPQRNLGRSERGQSNDRLTRFAFRRQWDRLPPVHIERQGRL
ncbi:hypothetical protein PACF725_0609 [Pseudomonas aeruginosa]|nr:hypothetical protein PACF725_0609 [Pseudomonas aeruginosa]